MTSRFSPASVWLILSLLISFFLIQPVAFSQDTDEETIDPSTGDDTGGPAAPEEAPAAPANDPAAVQGRPMAFPLSPAWKKPQPTGKNLLINGSFDDPEDAIKGWRYKFDLEGELQFYGDNHKFVDVVKDYKGRKNVLRMWGDITKITDRGEGVKVDGEFIPYVQGQRYRLSMWVSTTGPDCRILIEGYHWKPGIKPHNSPRWGEVRKVYKGKIMRLGSKDGAFSGAPKSWKQGFVDFPTDKASDLSSKHMSAIKFMVIHIIAISGQGGEIFFDDVVLERTK